GLSLPYIRTLPITAMPYPFDGIRVKIERAREQIVNLNAFVTDFAEKTYFFTLEDDPVQNRKEYRLHVGPGEDEGLARISVLSGEILHHLRSCFDHLIWQLIIKAGNDPTTRSEFPVFLNAADYVKRSSKKIKGVIEG